MSDAFQQRAHCQSRLFSDCQGKHFEPYESASSRPNRGIEGRADRTGHNEPARRRVGIHVVYGNRPIRLRGRDERYGPTGAAADDDDPGLFATGPTPVFIDEYQHVPEVLDSIKAES